MTYQRNNLRMTHNTCNIQNIQNNIILSMYKDIKKLEQRISVLEKQHLTSKKWIYRIIGFVSSVLGLFVITPSPPRIITL